jgi:hypothetical protein
MREKNFEYSYATFEVGHLVVFGRIFSILGLSKSLYEFHLDNVIIIFINSLGIIKI